MRDLARRAIAARLLEDAAAAEAKDAKAALAAEFDATGADRVPVVADDDTELGTVSRSKGRTSPKVVDDIALRCWVAERYPDEIVQTVRPGFVDRLLAAAKSTGEAIDPETGEIVPGIEVTTGKPVVSARPSPAARERMAELLAASPLLQLRETADEPEGRPVVIAPDVTLWPGLDGEDGAP